MVDGEKVVAVFPGVAEKNKLQKAIFKRVAMRTEDEDGAMGFWSIFL